MALLDIVPDTDPIMRKTSRRVRQVDDELVKFVEDMYETMVEHWGIGLAAIQVGVRRRLFIYEIPEYEDQAYKKCKSDDSPDTDNDLENPKDEDPPANGEDAHDSSQPEPDEDEGPIGPDYTGKYVVCINPKIITREGSFIDDEGCLSKEGWLAKVERAHRITFQAYDLEMKRFERTVEGLEARCVQHETDHLDGILFTDRAEPGTIREIKEDEEDTENGGENENAEQVLIAGKSEDDSID